MGGWRLLATVGGRKQGLVSEFLAWATMTELKRDRRRSTIRVSTNGILFGRSLRRDVTSPTVRSAENRCHEGVKGKNQQQPQQHEKRRHVMNMGETKATSRTILALRRREREE
mmetsp:Transcript_2592/g.7204  ORF Transcript_2592/g.7204 Transcript_2592/m.7204 type:complete len:113 (-) Transcript_2592:1775-2113(-)